jgi:hypothetical protein
VILEKRASFGWGATAAGSASPRSGIAVHFDGNNQGLANKSHTSCRTYWKATRKFHMGPSRGWLDIGYSFGCCPHGVIFEGRGLNHQQAAQPGGNSTWYSCTFMSGPKETPPKAQLTAFREFRSWLRGKGVAAALRGHRDFISTDCPGSILYGMVRNGTLATAPAAPKEEDVFTADDKKWLTDNIYRLVLQADLVPVPDGVDPGTNPNWRADNLLRNIYTLAAQDVSEVATLRTQVAQLAADIAAIKAAVIPTA